MPNPDLIEIALSAPIDWERFEGIAVEILIQDDLPRLRRHGRIADLGIDAKEEAFYEEETQTEVIVQVTSQRTQQDKLRRTINKLKDNGIEFNRLVMVYRQPTASTVIRDLQEIARKQGVFLDIRDQSYLITHLGKEGNGIFARHFQGLKEQVDILLGNKDPLQALQDRSRHAMLASIGAYVLHPHSQITRHTLFNRLVVSVVVAQGSSTHDEIRDELNRLLPGETIDLERVRAAIVALERSGEVKTEEDCRIVPTEDSIQALGDVLSNAHGAYENLRDSIFVSVQESCKVDAATLGTLERNLRRALLALLRKYGPVNTESAGFTMEFASSQDIHRILACDIDPDIAGKATIAFGSYLDDEQNRKDLASFSRSYSSLAIWNLDPLGRRWQEMVLNRSILALDTGVVLALLIEELPSHFAVRESVRVFSKAGVRIVISRAVIDEVAIHAEIAVNTYTRFRDILLRMSPLSVDSGVFNAFVRGFYYAVRNAHCNSWRSYMEKYLDEDDSEYIPFRLSRMVDYTVEPLDDVPDNWTDDEIELCTYIHDRKETHRRKAEYREDDEMTRRVEADVKMILSLASLESKAGTARPMGYLATDDAGLFLLEKHPVWQPRRNVCISSEMLPELASFLSGSVCTDGELVHLLFEPVMIACGELLSESIDTLSAVGVDLMHVDMLKLEWSLSKKLHDSVGAYRSAYDKEPHRSMADVFSLQDSAVNAGLPLDPTVSELRDQLDSTMTEKDKLRAENVEIVEVMKGIALAAGKTSKGRRRVNRALSAFGLSYDDLLKEDPNTDETDSREESGLSKTAF